MTERLEHPPHLTVASLVQREVDDRTRSRRRNDAQTRRRRAPFFELDAAANALDGVGLEPAAQRRPIDFVDAEPRMREREGELAVVRQQQHSRCVVVEPADGNETRRRRPSMRAHQIGDRTSSLRIVHRCYDPGGFVQNDDFAPARLERFDALSVELDVVARLDFRSELAHDAAVDAHPSRDDEGFARTPGCDSGACEIALQSYGESLRAPLTNRLPRA